MSLGDLLARKQILVCVGSGGVGKTTVAAAIALEAARRGRKALAVTIDPAKRLASSLGLRRLDHVPRPVPTERLAPEAGRRRGELWAMMLDQKRALDEFVERRVQDPESLRRVLDNRIYQSISTTLAGSQEYAAMAKLQALDEERRYDLIVVDTPPTANALDFLDAPRRITDAVDSPAIQWLIKPYLKAGRFSLKLVSFGGAFVLRRIARFVGSDFIDDMAMFLVEFNEVIGGFRQRAEQVFALLREDRVAFVLTAAPEPLAIDEAIFFYRRLAEEGMPFGAFVLNRVHTSLGPPPDPDEVIIRLTLRPELRGFSADDIARASQTMRGTFRDFEALARANQLEIARLARSCGREHLYVQVPFFERDVYDLEGLSLVGRHLFAPPSPLAPEDAAVSPSAPAGSFTAP